MEKCYFRLSCLNFREVVQGEIRATRFYSYVVLHDGMHVQCKGLTFDAVENCFTTCLITRVCDVYYWPTPADAVAADGREGYSIGERRPSVPVGPTVSAAFLTNACQPPMTYRVERASPAKRQTTRKRTAVTSAVGF